MGWGLKGHSPPLLNTLNMSILTLLTLIVEVKQFNINIRIVQSLFQRLPAIVHYCSACSYPHTAALACDITQPASGHVLQQVIKASGNRIFITKTHTVNTIKGIFISHQTFQWTWEWLTAPPPNWFHEWPWRRASARGKWLIRQHCKWSQHPLTGVHDSLHRLLGSCSSTTTSYVILQGDAI